jgi:hypothetical protein
MGRKLLDICKNNNIYIMNGRVGKYKSIGKLTFRKSSVIDYSICSLNLFPLISNFDVWCENGIGTILINLVGK